MGDIALDWEWRGPKRRRDEEIGRNVLYEVRFLSIYLRSSLDNARESDDSTICIQASFVRSRTSFLEEIYFREIFLVEWFYM